MSELNAMPLSALVETHRLCPKCQLMFPQRFLACPSCLGFQRKYSRWVIPGKPKPKREAIQEASLFDRDGAREYPV